MSEEKFVDKNLLRNLQTEQKYIQKSCLSLSDKISGKAKNYKFMTNEDRLGSGFVNGTSSIYAFTTCIDSNNRVTGLKFILSDETSSGPHSMTILDPIGKLSGECQ